MGDGSFKLGDGTAAWFQKPNPAHIESMASSESDQSAYQSEVGGLSGIATMARLICEHYGITQGTVTIACDGLSVS